jgi:hypothetical protein
MKRYWLVILAVFFFFVPPVSFGAAESISIGVEQQTSPTEFTLSYGSTIWGICNFNQKHGRLPSNVTVQQCADATLARHAIVDDRNIPVGTTVTIELLPIAEVQSLRAEVMRLKALLQRRVETSTQRYGESQVLKLAPKATTAQPAATVPTFPDQAASQTSWTINWVPLIVFLAVIVLAIAVLARFARIMRGRKVTIPDLPEKKKDGISDGLNEVTAFHENSATPPSDTTPKSAESKTDERRKTPTADSPAMFDAVLNPRFVDGEVEPEKRTLQIPYWFNYNGTEVFCRLPWKRQKKYDVSTLQRECLDSLEALEHALSITLKKEDLIRYRGTHRTTNHLFAAPLPTAQELLEKHYEKVDVAA